MQYQGADYRRDLISRLYLCGVGGRSSPLSAPAMGTYHSFLLLPTQPPSLKNFPDP